MNHFYLPNTCSLTLIFYPSPHDIDWSSPGGLLRSTIKNTFWGWEKKLNIELGPDGALTKVSRAILPYEKHPHPISHVDVCLTNSDGKAQYTGMSRINEFKEVTSALKGKSTFDKLFKDFPGKFIDENKIHKYLKRSLYLNQARWITFTLNQDTFDYLSNFNKEYGERNYQNIYAGFHAEPLKGEGAGCAHFARSFLRVANLNTPELDELWRFPLKIPYRLIPSKPEKADASIIDLLTARKNSTWGQDHEECIQLDIFDPSIMYSNLKNMIEDKSSSTHKVLNSSGLLIDKTEHTIDTNKSYWL